MKRTIDTLTGEPFRWNTTVFYELKDGQCWVVPARCTLRNMDHLHPGRVPAKLLAKLNDGRTWADAQP